MNMWGYIKKLFSDKNFLRALYTSVLSLIIILALCAGLIWHFRAKVFGYFAKEYLQEVQNEKVNGATGVQSSTSGSSGNQALFGQDSLVINAVKKTNPAVVAITISKVVPKYEEITPSPDENQNNPFGNMFPGFNFSMPQVPQYQQNGTQKEDIGGGSGFFVSSDGLIVTNKHVVDQAGAFYTVLTNDGKKHDAKVVARDPILDIALIKIEASGTPGGFTPLTLGDSDQLQVGQSVIAIGNALGQFTNTVSVGVISGLARSITAGDQATGSSEFLDQVIQTDAAINPGNSGGPLLDLSGNVIGVNVAVAAGSQSIGFALPINSVKGAIESVESTGKIVRPYLGVRYVAIDAAMQQANNLTVDYGVLVKAGANTSELAVIPGSPADKAGIVENDIILKVDGTKLGNTNSLASLIREKKVGDVVTLDILHKGVEKTVSVTLSAAPDTVN